MQIQQMLYKLAIGIKAVSREDATLTFVLSEAWRNASRDFIPNFIKLNILGDGTYNLASYLSLRAISIDKVTTMLGEAITSPVEDVLALAYTNGVAKSKVQMTEDLTEKLRDDLSSVRLASQVVGYATAYYERFIEPAIYKAFEQIAIGEVAGLGTDALRDSIINKVESDSYWKIIGSVFAARAFNFAILDAGYYSGYKQYTVINPTDELSGSVCDGILGRIFPIDKAIAIAYSLETSAPGGDKLIYPWPSDKDVREVEKLTDQQLIDMGLIIPPFHPHCSTEVELIS